MRTYRAYLKSIGRKPVKAVRTEKRAGDVEIVWCPKARDYVAHRHEGEASTGEVLAFPDRRRA